MSSSLDRFFEEATKWKNDESPILLVLKSELSKMEFFGYVAEADLSESRLVVKSDARDLPLWRFSLFCVGVTAVNEKGFDTVVLEQFGELFDSLDPSERGKLWARRVEYLFELRFGSDRRCVVLKLPN